MFVNLQRENVIKFQHEDNMIAARNVAHITTIYKPFCAPVFMVQITISPQISTQIGEISTKDSIFL